MFWILPALIAPLVWAASNLIDSHLVHAQKQDSLGLVTLSGLFALLPATVCLLSGDVVIPGLATVLLGLVSGIVNVAAFYPYYRALESVHPASAVLMWNLSPLLTAGLAWLFLSEQLAPTDLLAVLLLVASSVLASAPDVDTHRFSGTAMHWMGFASVLTASEAVLQKALFLGTNTETGIFVYSLGSLFCALLLLLLPATRKALRHLKKTRNAPLAIGNELLNVGGTVATNLAISLGPVTLVKAFEGMQPLFVLALGPLLVWRGRLRREHAPKANTKLILVASLIAIVDFSFLRD